MAKNCYCRLDVPNLRRIPVMGCPLHDAPSPADFGDQPETVRETEHFPFADHRSVAEVDADAASFRITAIPRPRAGEVHIAFDALGQSYTATIPAHAARQIAEALDGALAILDGQHPAQVQSWSQTSPGARR
jgi:hypothetical protein